VLRSLYSAISGMHGFQTKLDVIGNNIANVNTTGFKSGRVMFGDLLSQTVAGASTPGTNLGGTNPIQIGLGSKIASIDTIMTDGSTQTTNNPYDLSINGNGFFTVSDGTQTYYTRAGNFQPDAQGNLVLPNGFKLLDSSGSPIIIPPNPTSVSVDKSGNITVVDSSGSTSTLGPIGLASFTNSAGLTKAGDTMFLASSNSGTPSVGAPGAAGFGTLTVGALEMSNVDLTNEFTEMIIAQQGFAANSKVITTAQTILQDIINMKQ